MTEAPVVEETKQTPLRLFFSLTSGEIYNIAEDEVKNLDKNQIPLKNKPPRKCNRCYGRMYEGKHLQKDTDGWTADYYIPCSKCSKKCVDFEYLLQMDTIANNELPT